MLLQFQRKIHKKTFLSPRRGEEGHEEKKKEYDRGFTLIEMIVAIGLFALVAVGSLSVLATSSSAHRKTNSERIVLDGIGFAIDDMTQNIRFGSNFNCDTATATPDCPGGANSLELVDENDNLITYKLVLSGGKGRIMRNDQGIDLPLTDSSVDVEQLTFYVFNSTSLTEKTRIIISARGKGSFNDTKTETAFAVQTTVVPQYTR